MFRRRLRIFGLVLVGLCLALALASSSGADALQFILAWTFNKTQAPMFVKGEPVPEMWVCHDDVRLGSAGGHPDFEIQITGDCAFVPDSYNPASGAWNPAWQDVKWDGTYDYETGIGSERLKRGSTILYNVALQCEPGVNPFIFTGSCSVTRNINNAPSPDGAQGSPPLSGGRLDGQSRQSLIDWETAQQGPQEGEGMDLAPNSDPPRFSSPRAGGKFPNGVQVVLKSSGRGVPLSSTYVLEFYFTKPFPKPTGGRMTATAATPRVIAKREPNLTRKLDTSENPDGLRVSLAELQKMGHWEVRARMDVPTASWTGLIPFTSGFASKTAAAVPPSGGIGTSKKGLGAAQPSATPTATSAEPEAEASQPTTIKKQAAPSRIQAQ